MNLKTHTNDRLTRWIIVAIAVCAALTGCATQNSVGNITEIESGQGLVIGSVTVGDVDSEYRIYYQQKGSGSNLFGRASQGGFIQINNDSTDYGKTELFAISLPQGEYEFSSWRIVSGKQQIVPKDKFSISFDATSSQATYVGNFDFQNTISSTSSPSSNLVTFANKYESDVKLLNSQYKNLDFSAITPGIDPDLSLLWTQKESDTKRSLLFVVFSTF